MRSAYGPAVSGRIEVILADITTLDVDAIVNAANERMLGGGGVDGAIHRAAGPGLLEECRAHAEVLPGVRCPPGEARLTGGHLLRARWVVHTVGPVWTGGDAGEPQILASCYRSCIDLAVRAGARSIAFPAISTGVFGYPMDRAASIGAGQLASGLERHPSLERLIACCFDARTKALYDRLLQVMGQGGAFT